MPCDFQNVLLQCVLQEGANGALGFLSQNGSKAAVGCLASCVGQIQHSSLLKMVLASCLLLAF